MNCRGARPRATSAAPSRPAPKRGRSTRAATGPPAEPTRGRKIADIYASPEIPERHRHRYEVNTAYKDRLEQHGMRFAGMSPDGVLPETTEYADHTRLLGRQHQ